MSGKVVSLDSRRPGAKAKQKREIRYRKTFDYVLIVVMVILLCIGLVMVYSASYYTGQVRQQNSATDTSVSKDYYFAKQLVCVAIGAIGMLAIMFMDYHSFLELPWKKHRWMERFKAVKPYWLVLAAGAVCLLLVFTPLGIEVNGSRRWINVGVSVQPSEILKLAIIIFMSSSIGKAPYKLKSMRGLLPYFLMLALLAVPIYMQPNFSAILCIAALVVTMLIVGGARWPHIALVIGIIAVAAIIFVASDEYRLRRILAAQDENDENRWQINQSLYSLGSGGLFGRGLGKSMQKMLYLPMAESDFIFSILCEELGLVGGVVVLLLYAVFIWRGFLAAIKAPDLTGTLLCTGVIAMVALQVFLNVAVTADLIPVTGVVLPFLSYGGSGVIIFMCMAGLVLNVSRQGYKAPPVQKAAEQKSAQAAKEMAMQKAQARSQAQKGKKPQGQARPPAQNAHLQKNQGQARPMPQSSHGKQMRPPAQNAHLQKNHGQGRPQNGQIKKSQGQVRPFPKKPQGK